MKAMFSLFVLALCALPASAGSIGEFHEAHKDKIVSVRKNGAEIEIVYAAGVSKAEQEAIEAEKAGYDFSNAPDATRKEIDAAVAAKAADEKVSDDEYAKLIRIQNIQDKAKRDAEWQKLKPDLDAAAADVKP